MDNFVMYRTNSFTGNQEPFHDIINTLMAEEDQLSVVRGLAEWLTMDPERPDYTGTMLANMLGGFNADEYFIEFMERSEDYRREFYERTLSDIKKETLSDLTCCCWFTRKDIVLARKNGYGKFLCKESGVLRCYEPGMIIVKHGFDTLCAYEEQPLLSPDVITNNQLITKAQLNRLLELEEDYGKTLADTCLKKDVLNLLKRADKGLLGNSFTPSFEIRERRNAEERERIISDIL